MSDQQSLGPKEFEEIAHCGGQVTITVSTTGDTGRALQFGVRHSRPTAAAWCTMWVLPQGIPVGMIEVRGMGVPWNPAPVPGCIPVFLASDRTGQFGHRCPSCRGYWRGNAVPATWPMTCPYCGSRAPTHELLTNGQRRYVLEYCRLADQAVQSPDGTYMLDMDQVADAAGSIGTKPRFFYAEESQQNSFKCGACSASNDILGRYGYCSNCGTHNGLAELQKDVERIKARLATTGDYESCLRETVGAFDSMARQLAKQLAHRVPMTLRRRKEWKRRLFHSFVDVRDGLRTIFDIDLSKGVPAPDEAFVTLMFHRRHVYEHNGGEADEKYLTDSGDTSVRPKQLLRESRASVERLCALLPTIASNFVDGFHSIFPPEEKPIELHGGQRKVR